MTSEIITLTQFESFLFKSTDILRCKIESSKYKEFIFGMLFLKRLSDEFHRKREQLSKNNFAHLKDEHELINPESQWSERLKTLDRFLKIFRYFLEEKE